MWTILENLILFNIYKNYFLSIYYIICMYIYFDTAKEFKVFLRVSYSRFEW